MAVSRAAQLEEAGSWEAGREVDVADQTAVVMSEAVVMVAQAAPALSL